MKLYFSPGACSLSPHIALSESGLPYTLVKVDLKTKLTEDGNDFNTINPKGSVPALEIGSGEVLTEGPAIVQYIADQVPANNLAPAAGTIERYRLMSWLNFISTELHKGFSPLFNPATPDSVRLASITRLIDRSAIVAAHLRQNDYLLGSEFSVADGYLFVVLGWAGHLKLDLQNQDVLGPYLARIAARPAVRAAMVAEGLIRA